jgi:hypothetical protein
MPNFPLITSPALPVDPIRRSFEPQHYIDDGTETLSHWLTSVDRTFCARKVTPAAAQLWRYLHVSRLLGKFTHGCNGMAASIRPDAVGEGTGGSKGLAPLPRRVLAAILRHELNHRDQLMVCGLRIVLAQLGPTVLLAKLMESETLLSLTGTTGVQSDREIIAYILIY